MNHVSRAGAGPGAASRGGPNVGGATHKRARVPVKSNPAAFLAAIRWASYASGLFCAKALAPDKLEMIAIAARTWVPCFHMGWASPELPNLIANLQALNYG